MHVLIVYTHPEPTSFNAALKDAAVETIASSGHSVEASAASNPTNWASGS
jgi:NAD(P)H dehydrogenase (quinone)